MEIFRKIGSWLFLFGVLIALIAGIIVGARWYTDTEAYIAMILGVLGFIVGVLSFFAVGQITHERIPTFLIGALILVVIGATSNYWETWGFVQNQDFAYFFQSLTGYIAIFAAPAAALLAIRAIWDAGKTEEIEKYVPKMPK
ncbi:MAG: hypothetical protein AYK22_00240 [Thermoplasmatales archaeon SG8-52-3]|nr:MAG: hypothetical protein AYK22_00240 [Thermoplasmatales archaeon SG8-52-3]